MRVCGSLLVFLSLGVVCSANTIIVDPNGTGDYTEIQPALDAAEDGDEVVVKPGEYVITEPIDFNRLHDPDDPESPPVKNLVLRSEAGADETVLKHTFYVVYLHSREDTSSCLEGFTLTGGVARCESSSPTLKDCTFPGIELGCEGMCDPTPLQLINSSARVMNCRIVDSERSGIVCDGDSSPLFVNCIVASNYGAGVSCDGAHPAFKNCMIAGNGGTGLSISSHSGAEILNCVITANGLREGHPQISVGTDSPVTIKNTIIWNSSLPSILAAVDPAWSRTTATHCCIQEVPGEEVWEDTGNFNEDPRFRAPGNWDWGDPDDPWDDVFTVGDYHLQTDSPCLDTGTTDDATTFDLEGNGRPCGAGVDMGAYESGDCPSPTLFRRADPSAGGGRTITDAVLTLLYLFSSGDEPTCLKAADSDDSGGVDLTDAVFLLNWLFLSGPSPDAPFPDCGWDFTIDELTCESFPACE